VDGHLAAVEPRSADFLAWQQKVVSGAAVNCAASVPEPSGMLIALAAMLGAGAGARPGFATVELG
jgi:hypothetical protein